MDTHEPNDPRRAGGAAFLRKAIDWISSRFWLRRMRAPQLDTPQPPLVEAPKLPDCIARERVERLTPSSHLIDEKVWQFGLKDIEQNGVFYFRRTVLDKLDTYFKTIKRMKLAAPTIYELYCKTGVPVLPRRLIGSMDQLPALWRIKNQRPSFGGISFAEPARDLDDCMLQMLLFTKQSLPSSLVEPFNGDVYEIHGYMDDAEEAGRDERWRKHAKWMRKRGFCATFYVGVSDNNELKVLRTLQTRYSKNSSYSYNSSKTRRTHSQVSIPQKVWDYPETLCFWARNSTMAKDNPDRTPDRLGKILFNVMANFHSIADEGGIRINVNNAVGDRAVFCIDMKRSAYFFKDREPIHTSEGKIARIFHIVRPHERHTTRGNTVVKMHFRGLRKFVWGGHTVHLTVPGLHHQPLSTWTLGTVDKEAWDNSEPTVAQYKVTAALAEHIDGASLTEAFKRAGAT